MPKEIIDYVIVRNVCTGDLTAAVRKRIAEGWQPFGELKVAQPSLYLFQVMVKYREPIEQEKD